MSIFHRGQHRGQKASNYSGGAPAYQGRHVDNPDDFNHANKLCGCDNCPSTSHCEDHGNGCHVKC